MDGAGDLLSDNQLQRMMDSGQISEVRAQEIRGRQRARFDANAERIEPHAPDWSGRTYIVPVRLECPQWRGVGCAVSTSDSEGCCECGASG